MKIFSESVSYYYFFFLFLIYFIFHVLFSY